MSLIHDCFYQFVLQRIIKEIWVRDRQIALKLCKHYEKGLAMKIFYCYIHTTRTNNLGTLSNKQEERKILFLFVKTLLPTRMIFNRTHYHLPIVRENWPILYSKFLTKAMLYHTPWGPSITDVCSGVNLWEKSNLVGGHLRSMWDYFLDA